MIDSVAVAAQTVAAGSNVIFTTDRVRSNSSSGCHGWLYHNASSGQYLITKPGVYNVAFNCNVTASAAGAVTLALRENGEALGGTTMAAQIAAADNLVNVSTSALIKVPCGTSVTVTVGNTGSVGAIVSDANITITREC